eukprot:748710-Pyramimonas_sp.AAC.1
MDGAWRCLGKFWGCAFSRTLFALVQAGTVRCTGHASSGVRVRVMKTFRAASSHAVGDLAERGAEYIRYPGRRPKTVGRLRAAGSGARGDKMR